MPWVYRELFEASGLDPEAYLPLRRLDPAFRVILSDGRSLTIPADPGGPPRRLRRDRPGRRRRPRPFPPEDRPLRRADRPRLLRPDARELGPGDALPPAPLGRPDLAREELRRARSTSTSGRPPSASCSTASRPIPGSTRRRPRRRWRSSPGRSSARASGIRPRGASRRSRRAIAGACRSAGSRSQTGVEVEAIELDAERRRPVGRDEPRGRSTVDAVVSNSDYVHTHRMLRGGQGFSAEVEALRAGRAAAVELVPDDPARLQPSLARPGAPPARPDRRIGPGLRRAVPAERIPVATRRST